MKEKIRTRRLLDGGSDYSCLVEVTGCGCPVDTSVQSTEAPTEAGAETSNLQHLAPKEIRSTCFRSFLAVSAPFRSKTHPFRRSYLHCFRVLRSAKWDKLWSNKTPRMQLRAASEVFFVVCMVTLPAPKVKAFRETKSSCLSIVTKQFFERNTYTKFL